MSERETESVCANAESFASFEFEREETTKDPLESGQQLIALEGAEFSGSAISAKPEKDSECVCVACAPV